MDLHFVVKLKDVWSAEKSFDSWGQWLAIDFNLNSFGIVPANKNIGHFFGIFQKEMENPNEKCYLKHKGYPANSREFLYAGAPLSSPARRLFQGRQPF